MDDGPKTIGVPNTPWSRDANIICATLVREVNRAGTWAQVREAADAINRVRMMETSHNKEWEHLRNPGPNDYNTSGGSDE